MEYKPQHHFPRPNIRPRLIIHGGAGNIRPATMPLEKRRAYREALFTIVTKTNAYMHPSKPTVSASPDSKPRAPPPSALETATFAVTLLEDNPLFNAGRGAVFTRDGINELEASVMVSRGRAKRGVGVGGLRRVRNPILLARGVLEHGDGDLLAADGGRRPPSDRDGGLDVGGPDVPSAQGHTQIFGATAEKLAGMYGLEMVDPGYFFTQERWDEHVRGLEREKGRGGGSPTWSAEEYLPQGTVGAVALDEEGVVCCATSTGGITNKLTGRIGDTPVVGAGFWAEEWVDEGGPTGSSTASWVGIERSVRQAGPVVTLSETLKGLLAECIPVPYTTYTPIFQQSRSKLVTTRSLAASGTGNGDSFLRIAAVRTVGAIARFARVSGATALSRVVGPFGELQKSAGDRWGRTGEGEGGMIAIECVVVRDEEGNCVETRGEILQDFNCGGMFRAWIDEAGEAQVRMFRDE